MITQYFDINQRLIIQSPGTLAPASSTAWVYGDNYNLAIYLTSQGIIQPISANDTLGLMLFQPVPTLPESNLAIISIPTIKTDPAGFQYYLINVNLLTVPLAALVQTPNKPANCQFHYIFTPADGERFSSSADLAITVNPDPSQSATGATPIPPGYPTSPNVFELIAHKGAASGYASLDATGKVPTGQLPTATAGGDMLKSVYDTNNNGIVDTCDTLVSSRVTGLGTAAVVNVPATGNASATQAVLGSDTRLTDVRTAFAHEATHNGGSDAIPLASATGQGLCPPVDGTTVQVVSGKLTATTTGSGDMLKSVYVTGSATNANTIDNALAVQTHQVPAAGNASGAQLVIATDTRLSDSRQPQLHASTHLAAGSDPIALASSAAGGLCPPVDNVTIQVSGGKLAAFVATTNAPGIVKPDGTSITISGNTISAPSGGVGQHGTRLWSNVAITAFGVAIPFTQELYSDPDVYWSASNPTRITIPTGQGGFYMIGGSAVFNASATAGTYRALVIQWNGSTNRYLAGQSWPMVAANTNSLGQHIAVSTLVKLNAGEYIELFAFSDRTSDSILSAGTAPNCYSPVFYALRIS